MPRQKARKHTKVTPAGKKKTPSKSGRVYSTYDQEYKKRPEVKKKAVQRQRDRREALSSGRRSKGDGKDVHHIKGAAAGDGPTRIEPASTNRARKEKGK